MITAGDCILTDEALGLQRRQNPVNRALVKVYLVGNLGDTESTRLAGEAEQYVQRSLNGANRLFIIVQLLSTSHKPSALPQKAGNTEPAL